MMLSHGIEVTPSTRKVLRKANYRFVQPTHNGFVDDLIKALDTLTVDSRSKGQVQALEIAKNLATKLYVPRKEY